MLSPEQLDDGLRVFTEQDRRDSRRALADCRKFAAANRAAINAEWDAETIPPRTIAGHLAAPLDPRAVAEWEG